MHKWHSQFWTFVWYCYTTHMVYPLPLVHVSVCLSTSLKCDWRIVVSLTKLGNSPVPPWVGFGSSGSQGSLHWVWQYSACRSSSCTSGCDRWLCWRLAKERHSPGRKGHVFRTFTEWGTQVSLYYDHTDNYCMTTQTHPSQPCPHTGQSFSWQPQQGRHVCIFIMTTQSLQSFTQLWFIFTTYQCTFIRITINTGSDLKP